METKYFLYCLADMILIATSLVYGVKLLKRRNYLLAGEWLVVTFSASNLLINAFTGAMPFYHISLFCDAFSRSFGIPVIAIAGLMAATHRYRPSTFVDVTYFAVGLVVTTIVWTADFMVAPKPYFYLAAWSVFSLYLAYFIKRLLAAGEGLHALSTTVALVAAQTIATVYDFYHIPGDDDHMVFYIFALLTWAYQCVAVYYAYCALERAQEPDLNRGYAYRGVERHS
jgi:hypothetical protein